MDGNVGGEAIDENVKDENQRNCVGKLDCKVAVPFHVDLLELGQNLVDLFVVEDDEHPYPKQDDDNDTVEVVFKAVTFRVTVDPIFEGLVEVCRWESYLVKVI